MIYSLKDDPKIADFCDWKGFHKKRVEHIFTHETSLSAVWVGSGVGAIVRHNYIST